MDEDGEAPAPRKNPHLLGHEWAEQHFLDAWNSGRLPHGWLITGPRGIGKASFAFRVARFALAGGAGGGQAGLFGAALPDTLAIDAQDPVFRRVASGGHADMMTLERSVNPDTGKLRSVIVVDDVRAAGSFLSLTPAEGGWRILVVDAADELNANAANALLKMLEEPPDRALILLVSHAPGRLLATIRSRCCRIQLRPLGDETVANLLSRYCPDLGAADATTLITLAEGSIGRALQLAGEGGLDLYRDLAAMLDALPALDTAAVHGFGDRVARRGAEDMFRTATELLAWWVARTVRTGAVRTTARPGGLDRWLEVWEKINRLAVQSDALNLDRKQVMLNLFFALQRAARA